MLSCTLPWTRGSSTTSIPAEETVQNSTLVENDRDDSAFCEPEYSNPASFDSLYQNTRKMTNLKLDEEDDFIPDYEEVDEVQVQQLRQSLLRRNPMLHKEIYQLMSSKKHQNFQQEQIIDRSADNTSTQERIMQSLIYCIHKVKIDLVLDPSKYRQLSSQHRHDSYF